MISNNELFEQAKALSNEKQLTAEAVLGYVGAALLTETGVVYTGMSFSGACGIGYCGETGAILEMLKNGESKIKKIVAVSNDYKCMPPCGRCREMMYQADRENLNTEIILGNDKVITLKELLPERWQELWE